MGRLLDRLKLAFGKRKEIPIPRDVCAPRESWDSTDLKETFCISVENRTFDTIWVSLSGKMFMDNADLVREELLAIIRTESLKNVVMDMGQVAYLDSAGAAILTDIYRKCKELNNTVKLANVPERVTNLLEMVDLEHFKESAILKPREAPGLLVQIGEGAEKLYANAKDIVIFIGAVAQAMGQDLIRPRKIKWDRLWKLVERAGADGVPIVAALSFLMGVILAFQAAIQLRKFGGNIFVADLVSVSICLEMGPLLAGMIVTGRSGAAYAAQIGTMQVTEEIDALRVMAIDPINYLVAPRILAVALVLPCLTLMADLMGIFGGCLVAAFSLDLTPTTYFNQVRKVLEVSDVMKGLGKSMVYGIEIALIGCLRGFQVRGGAESVGGATTSAVVTSIFVLTVTNAVFSLLFHYVPKLWSG
ncbi:MAG TPA: MlaE family lipid ABC transporter permease subunit [Desulfomonilaceae bacterium]|nr:MlaE family lipid ABC transporter permease subunit [Desulfomonilaceae bacterium]